MSGGCEGNRRMEPRAAMERALTHQDVRPVPFSIKFTVEARDNWQAYLGHPFDPIVDTGSCVVASHTNNGWREIRPGYFEDYFGVVWNKTADKTLGVVDVPPLQDASLRGFSFPNPENIPVYGFIEKNNRVYPQHFHMLSIGFALFERAWSLVGMANLFEYFFTEPEFLHDLLDRIADYNVAVIRRAAALGVDCVHFGDDWGSQQDCLISPEMWRDFIRPRYARMCAAARESDLWVSLHCCGNVEKIMEDICACGTDVFDPFQPEAMDIWGLRETFRNRMAFWGGLSVQRTLPHGTPEDVRRETRLLLEKMAPGGGYILSPSHSITGDVPAENIASFLDVARNQP